MPESGPEVGLAALESRIDLEGKEAGQGGSARDLYEIHIVFLQRKGLQLTEAYGGGDAWVESSLGFGKGLLQIA